MDMTTGIQTCYADTIKHATQTRAHCYRIAALCQTISYKCITLAIGQPCSHNSNMNK